MLDSQGGWATRGHRPGLLCPVRDPFRNSPWYRVGSPGHRDRGCWACGEQVTWCAGHFRGWVTWAHRVGRAFGSSSMASRGSVPVWGRSGCARSSRMSPCSLPGRIRRNLDPASHVVRRPWERSYSARGCLRQELRQEFCLLYLCEAAVRSSRCQDPSGWR